MTALVTLLFALAVLAIVAVSRWHNRGDSLEQRRRTAEDRLRAVERRNVRRRDRQEGP